jgi:hypothetical protein
MTRYTCTCDPDQYNQLKDQYSYPRQAVLDLPQWSLERKRRLRAGLSPTVCIDQCIVDAIKHLWSKGIETTGCCCGHNTQRAWVSVHPSWYVDMFELGYEQRPVEVIEGKPYGVYSFYL